MKVRVFDVTDPQGFEHAIMWEDEKWFGCENLAHGFSDYERQRITRQVCQAALSGLGTCVGFSIKEAEVFDGIKDE